MGNKRVSRGMTFPDGLRRPLGILLIWLMFAAVLAQPALADTPCPIPDQLALRDIALPAARQQVAKDQHLVVLTFGGIQPAGADAEAKGATFPARLEAELRGALPHVDVTVKNEPPPGKTSADVPGVIGGLIEKAGARLVIWGPGGRDVMAHMNLDSFFDAVNGGIEAVHGGGADLILLDTTFVPSPARMTLIDGYRQRLLSAAEAHQVPLLRRHALMRQWSEDGTINLAARDQAEREAVIRHLFACVAKSLAAPIAQAVR